jgi:hypothetical protein
VTDDELKALVESLAVDSKELREAQKATDEQMKPIIFFSQLRDVRFYLFWLTYQPKHQS